MMAISELDGKQSDPLLPVELWKVILRMATYESPMFDTDCKAIHASDKPSLYLRGQMLNENNDSAYSRKKPTNSRMYTKIAATLVCRAWRSLSFEFLYEIVVLNQAQLDKVPADFLAPPVGYYSPLNYIRYLDLDCFEPGRMKDQHYEERICQFLKQCSHLQIYVHRPSSYELPPFFLTHLFTICGSSLIWVDMGSYCMAEHHSRLLATHVPNLQYLAVSGVRSHPKFGTPCSGDKFAATLPALHTLVAGTQELLDCLSLWDLPSLQSVSLRAIWGWGNESGKFETPAVQEFFQRYGTNIQFLTCYNSDTHIRPIVELCPKLESLALYHEAQWESLKGGYFPHIRGINIRHFAQRRRDSPRTLLDRCLETSCDRVMFPALEVIEVIGHSDFQTEMSSGEWVARLRAQDIRLVRTLAYTFEGDLDEVTGW